MISTVAMLGLIKRAMPAPGYRRHGYTIHEWDISGSCQKPVTRELLSRPLRLMREYVYWHGSEKPFSMILHVRCRMCDACRRLKQFDWTQRAMAEVHSGARTWFGTMTLAPDAQFRMVTQARRRLLVGGTDYEELSPQEQFAEVMTEINREVTLWLKRVRKESGAKIRYLFVAEAHASGAPHLHCLITEVEADAPVKYRTLASQWALGFTKFKLCLDSKAARYVCKYISKSLMSRVRASLRYGTGSNEREGGDDRNTGSSIDPESADLEKSSDVTKTYERTEESDNGEFVNPVGCSLTDHSGGEINGIDVKSDGSAADEAYGIAKRSRLSGSADPPF